MSIYTPIDGTSLRNRLRTKETAKAARPRVSKKWEQKPKAADWKQPTRVNIMSRNGLSRYTVTIDSTRRFFLCCSACHRS